VEQHEIEYELDFTRGNDPGQASYHVHLRCYAAWAYACWYFGTAWEAIPSSPMRSATHPATDGGASESN
jgi:hypothetical protein